MIYLAYLMVTGPLLKKRLRGQWPPKDLAEGGYFTMGKWGLPVNIFFIPRRLTEALDFQGTLFEQGGRRSDRPEHRQFRAHQHADHPEHTDAGRDLQQRLVSLLETDLGGRALLHDLLELHQEDRVGDVVEQLREQLAVRLVGLVLEAVDLDPVLRQRVHRPQPRHRVGRELGGTLEHLHLVGDPRGQLVDLVEHDEVRGLVHEVHAVVEVRREHVDVVAVERRDEGLVEAPHDRVRRVVGRVLGVRDALADLLAGGAVRPERLTEEVGPGHEVLRRFGEEVEVRGVARGEAQAHGNLRDRGTDGFRLGQRKPECLTATDGPVDIW